MYVIKGEAGNQKVYWRKWSGACVSGRPKWVYKMSTKCMFEQLSTAEKTAEGKGSSHWHTVMPDGTPVTGIGIETVFIH